MCGIVGFVGKSKEAKKIIDSMNNKLIHRGPDDFGTYIDENCALGHRRLAIIDLKTGKQPISDGNYTIIFNGEIYNFLELKEELKKKYTFKTKTDTEVILKGYQEWGTDVLKKLRGMFAIAIWDSKKKELFLARDQWGIKPLYYYMNNGTFMFASEIKALLEHPDFKKEFNGDILSAYLCFNSVPTEESFFKGVFKLKPGHFLLYKNGKYNIERFFKLEFDETKQDEEELVKKIQNVMVDSVEHHKIADVEVGSFLSSGVDSSYVVSLLKPNKTFTASFDPKYAKYDEIKYAKDLSDKLGIENKSYIITKEEYLKEFPKIMYYMDEPLADPSAIALYFVAKEASKYVKVVTSGEGADELFCGYGDYREEVDHAWYNKIPYPIRHLVSMLFSHYKWQELKGVNFLYRKGQKLENYFIGDGKVYTDQEANKVVKLKNQIKTKDITKPYYEEYKDCSNTVKRQVIDFYFWLINDYLTAVDRNAMIFSLEARTPFLDKEVFKVASTMDLDAKVNKETTKVALRKAAKDVVPNTNYKKPKLGFPVPLREWIREDELYNEIKDKFNSKIAEKYFDQKYIINLLDKHKSGKVDCFKKVWTVYTFIIWYEQYFDINEEA